MGRRRLRVDGVPTPGVRSGGSISNHENSYAIRWNHEAGVALVACAAVVVSVATGCGGITGVTPAKDDTLTIASNSGMRRSAGEVELRQAIKAAMPWPDSWHRVEAKWKHRAPKRSRQPDRI